MTKNLILISAVLFVSAGCLKTRKELRESGGDTSAPVQKQTAAQQRAEAAKPEFKAPPAGFRFEEYDEQLRQMNGKVETAEAKIQQLEAERAAEQEKNRTESTAKQQAYEEELKKLNEQVQLLSEQMTLMRSQQAAPAPVVKAEEGPAKKNDKSTPYDDGEALSKEKKWKEAIVAYEKYRSTYPRGKNFLDATYKIGLCFHELGMKDEARAFYEEVVAKAPKSKEAKKAAFRLKNVK